MRPAVARTRVRYYSERMKRLPDNATVDPYSPPELPRATAPGTRATRKPTVLTAIGVLMIVLGGLYALTWAFSVVTLISGPQIFRSSQPTNNATLDQAKANYDQALDAVQAKYAVVQTATVAVQTLVFAALIAGGVFLLRLPLRHRVFIWSACAAALVFELVCVIPLALMQFEHLGAANQYLNELSGAGDQGSAIQAIATISLVAAAVVFVTLFAARVIFYAWALRTLGRPEQRAWFWDEGGEVVAARVVE